MTSSITLKELLQVVKEQNLSKDQLERYRDELSVLFAEVHLRMAEMEKMEALFFVDVKKNNTIEITDIGIKRLWRAKKEGQELIELSHTSKAIEKLLSSLKSRLYSLY
jgi:hypothetical protein